ncbi:hypothetical protein FBZ86_12425 [Gluconacetobacter diazotrophicus]|nr:hypothetical protein FBZ86_12425 [Gluconacetobacter diazotrophicus]
MKRAQRHFMVFMTTGAAISQEYCAVQYARSHGVVMGPPGVSLAKSRGTRHSRAES